jgi:hypothetical protein
MELIPMDTQQLYLVFIEFQDYLLISLQASLPCEWFDTLSNTVAFVILFWV